MNSTFTGAGTSFACPGLVEEQPDRLPPAVAVVERQVVHVHADEPVGLRLVEPAAELHRVLERLVAMVERVRDAVVQQPRDASRIALGPEIAPDDVAAERQRQPAGAVGPPLAEVDDLRAGPLPRRSAGLRESAGRRRPRRRARLPGSRSNGMTSYFDARARYSRSARNAVVSSPGTPTRTPSSDVGPSFLATTIGP